VAGGRVRVAGLTPDSRQADVGLLGVLERMGCRVERQADGVTLRGPGDGLAGVDVDMNAMPDAVLALAVVAAFAKEPTRIRNVAHLRIKESDRLAALATELRKLGCQVREHDDGLEIQPGALRGTEIDTYGDHRMAMAFAMAGLQVPGVRIRDPEVVSKSWPKYFEALAGL
jgi:3-phosphoshikimate 1-carboxyvinyltransferase